LTALRIDALVLHPVRIPLGRTVAWASSSETAADYMILELRAGGARGVAEGTVKLTFAGETLKTLACAFEDIFAPRLMGVDAADESAIAKALAGVREHRLAQAMIDAAISDLRAQAAGKPLWRLLGASSGTVPLSFTVTRASPAEMAAAARAAVAEHGFGTLKIKTGQGLDRDANALDAIRVAVGDGVALYCDSNRAYPPEDVAAVTALFAERGALAAEDPCALAPDRAFRAVRECARVPILVDGPCRDLASARLFFEAGAAAVSVKLGKSGIGESLAIADAARAAGARVHVGMLAECDVGALAAASLSAALGDPWLPCEASYFLQLPEGVLKDRPKLADGALMLPGTAGFADLVDWQRVARLAP
jgi:L-alanine-DL-glutamate epimerase-like enolase superfamily enzyme